MDESGNRCSLGILSTIKELQAHFGLRHGDYMRYRQYCSRKLRRLRRSLRLTNGKSRFMKKKLTPEVVREPRVFELPLVAAERAWSYAMQLKQESMEENSKVKSLHLIRRLRKAAKHAEELKDLCAVKGDTRTALEAEAYATHMKANVLLEKENWEEAMQLFVQARTVYDELSKIGTSAEQDVYKRRVTEMEPTIRYCHFNLSGDGEVDVHTLLDLKKASEQDTALDVLSSKLQAVLEETRKKQAENVTELEWCGTSVPVLNSALRECLLSAQEHEYELNKETDDDAKMSLFDQIFISYGDAISVVSEEAKSTNSVKIKSNCESTLAFLRHTLLEKTIERNQLLVDTQMAAGDTPLNIVRLYDRLLANLEEMSATDDVATTEELRNIVSARSYSFKGARCFHLGEHYSSVGSIPEAVSLYDRALRLANTAAEEFGKCSNAGKGDLKTLDILQDSVRKALVLVRANEVLSHVEIEREMASVDIKPLSGLSAAESLDSVRDDTHVIDFPPHGKPVGCKPTFFDVSGELLQYPDLTERAKKKRGGFFGFFARG